jgi:hypothetical protein
MRIRIHLFTLMQVRMTIHFFCGSVSGSCSSNLRPLVYGPSVPFWASTLHSSPRIHFIFSFLSSWILTLVRSRTLHSPADPDPQPWTFTQIKYWRSSGGHLLLAAKEREGYGHQEQGVPAEKVSTACFNLHQVQLRKEWGFALKMRERLLIVMKIN